MMHGIGRWVAALALAVFAFQHGAAAQDEPIKLGAIFNSTGGQALFDGASLNGARLAVEAVNAAGGVNGRMLSLEVGAGDSRPDLWPGVIDTMLAEHPDIVAFFGLSDTDNALAAGATAANKERVFLTSGATSPLLPKDIPEYFFLACFGDNTQAAVAAEWAYEVAGVKSALVLVDPNETYPVLLKDYFLARFEQLGGMVSDVLEVDPNTQNLAVPDPGSVDAVFLSVETAADAVRLIPLLRDKGFEGIILGGDGYDAPSVWAEHPDIDNVYFTTHVYLGEDNPNPRVGAFMEAYGKAYSDVTPTGFAALGYDAVGVLAAALAKESAVSPAATLASMPQVEDFQGVTGTISYKDGSRIPTKSVTILQVGDGTQSFVAERTPQSVPQN